MMSEDRSAVKVTDFGICQVDSRDATELTQATQLGDVLGTPNYMSPEQVAGGKVDARSDLFSVGVVLYRLVTGVLPFEGDSVITVAYKIAQAEAPAVEKLRRDVPLSLRRVDRSRAEEAAGEALPDRRGVRAGADRDRARARRGGAAARRQARPVRWACAGR